MFILWLDWLSAISRPLHHFCRKVHRLYGAQTADGRIQCNIMIVVTMYGSAIAVDMIKHEEEAMRFKWPDTYRLGFNWFTTKEWK